MKILLMGPQGSGKGTLGEMLSQRLGLPLISVGDILRAVPPDHPFYQELQEAMLKGVLAPSHRVAELLKERVLLEDCANGFIFDGWVRALEDLTHFDPGFDAVLNISVSRETSIKRISGRRICTSNGKTYNIYTLPPELLAECTGELIQRKDDTEEAVKARLDIYYTQTQEVLDYFSKNGLLREVNGEGTPAEVFELALRALGVN